MIFAGCSDMIFAGCSDMIFAGCSDMIFAGCSDMIFAGCSDMIFAGCSDMIFAVCQLVENQGSTGQRHSSFILISERPMTQYHMRQRWECLIQPSRQSKHSIKTCKPLYSWMERVWNQLMLTMGYDMQGCCINQCSTTSLQASVPSLRPVHLLYGAECWTPLRKDLKRLDSFHNRCIHSTLGITNQQQWDNHITSQSIRRQWGDMETVSDKVSKRRLEWLGYLARMPDKHTYI